MGQVQLIKLPQLKLLTSLALLKTFPRISDDAAFKHSARCNIFMRRLSAETKCMKQEQLQYHLTRFASIFPQNNSHHQSPACVCC